MGTTVDDQQVCNLYNQFIKSLRKGKYAICVKSVLLGKLFMAREAFIIRIT